MKLFIALIALVLISSGVLVSCNSNNRASHRTIQGYSQIGSVSRIEIIQMEHHNSGGGAVLGAVLGGVIGHQIGGGRGRSLATGAGAIGGAIAGNSIENRNKNENEIYRVSVNFDNGRSQEFDYQDIANLRVGDRVRVESGQIYPL